MKRLIGMLVIAVTMPALAVSSPSAANPLNTVDDIEAAIGACWNAPPDQEGSFVTLSFSFKRDGTLIGPPRPTEISVAGDEQARARFVDDAIAAINQCMPLSFSPTLADGIAGQVFTMQLGSSNR
jgi:hypothetical protein